MRVKTEERRLAILDIAKELFITKGFSQTSMSEIAKQLGGSKATLYNYFSSKEDIFAAVMEAAATQDLSTAFESLSTKSPLREVLVKFGATYLNCILSPEIAALHKMAIMQADRSKIGRFFYEKGPKRGWQNVRKFLDSLIAESQLRPCDAWIAAIHFKAMLEAEVLEPYLFGVIDKPKARELDTIVERAVDSFLVLYQNHS